MVPSVLEVTRDRAWETLTRYTKSEALLRHALAVEASVRAYARKFGEDEELWGVTALLHDFDYEIHPTLDKHPQDGAPILREEGYPEVVIEGVLSHAEHLAMPRDTPLKKTLFACDELSGFIHACGLVRPDGIETLEPKSVKKKLKQPSFAAGVHRDEVYRGAEELGVELDDHIRFVIEAMRPIAGELGLRQSAEQALEVVVARPVAARDADQVAARELADDHALAAELGDELGRVARRAEGDEAGLVRLRDDLETLLERGAALRGHLGHALEAPVRRDVESGREAGERRRADPAAVEALRALAGDVRAVGLVLGLGEVARERDGQRVRVGDDERAGHVRPAEPLLARDRVVVDRIRLDGDRARRLRAVDEDRQARSRP